MFAKIYCLKVVIVSKSFLCGKCTSVYCIRHKYMSTGCGCNVQWFPMVYTPSYI